MSGNNFIVEINYLCADFIGDSITKITSNKARGLKARVLYLEGIFVIESPIKSKQKYFISIIKRLLMFYPMLTDFLCFKFIFEIMLRKHVCSMEQRTFVSL